jgi:hypothetical protein
VIRGVVVSKGLDRPAGKRMAPLRWYVMVKTDDGEFKRLFIDHSTYINLNPSIRINRDERGTIVVVPR